LFRAGNGDLLASCRTDVPRRLKGKTLDHYEGLEISISWDDSLTWSAVKKLYDYGRHHSSLVLMSNQKIVMICIVRLGYADDPNSFPQSGIKAVSATITASRGISITGICCMSGPTNVKARPAVGFMILLNNRL